MAQYMSLTKLPELAVGNQKSSQSAEALESLLAMALGGVLINGCVWRPHCIRVEVLGLPDEVLQEVALILGQQQVLCLLNYLTSVGNECLTL
jgi:hypothetical protein